MNRTTGVSPLGAQVRERCDVIETAASSSKTSHAPSVAAVACLWPGLLHPAGHRRVDPGRPAQAWPSGQSTPSGLPSIPAVPPNASVVCNFTASEAPMEIDLVAVSEGEVAVNLALPQIAALGNLSADEVMTFSKDEPGIGQTRVTPGRGTAAVARVAVAGKGDLALVVSQGSTVTKADPALAGESLMKVAEALAAQLRP
ncbi:MULTISPECIES: hypothetical protein [unclassified Streptomyces]|uniref:hypothetical protein n=1 Tax=unclassified Streptomyces TaxID=2593676 RepID=UPI002255EDDB|nr:MULTISPECIES: hypothetical protein [unclassified Streptomyces]MCX4529937.1 hypothetical protein [Streptomyces sp. NBC_01551]MCX4546826.1 hypothetical protein [Streptomyces sp. NBC_01565]